MGDSFHKTQLMLRLRPKQPLNRIEAWVCLAVNVIACPGLGTWYARRWTGYPQLVLMGSSFGMFLGILGWMMVKVSNAPDVSPFTPEVVFWWKIHSDFLYLRVSGGKDFSTAVVDNINITRKFNPKQRRHQMLCLWLIKVFTRLI